MGAVNSSKTLANFYESAQGHIFIVTAVGTSNPATILISTHTTTLQDNIL
jgi:hypothetical protein